MIHLINQAITIIVHLNYRVCGPRGITAVIDNFKHVKLQGKGHEKSDLEIILSQMEHWTHRLFPKLPFDDCVENVAKLGNTKSVQVFRFSVHYC